jgi:apolipoprotein N-acyltransferase
MASVIGEIGLSFFVFWCNIVVFYWIFLKKPSFALPAMIITALPYLIGGGLYIQKTRGQQAFDITHSPHKIAFCHMEEPPDVYSRPLSPENLHEQEWQKILHLVSTLTPGEVDLIVLPEGVAPYSAESPLFLSSHLPDRWKTKNEPQYQFLSSLDLSQIIASSLKTSLLLGLEGRGIDSTGTIVAYNSCFFVSSSSPTISRYDKQLLLPLGEYIPFPFLRSYLANYGIHDSFSPGDGCVLFKNASLRISPLICYEKTFSTYAIAASHLQPNLLVSLSNDCWYPYVRREHFELARLRSVEIGIPMVRSCNQGVSGAVDALGRTIDCRGEHHETENSCVTLPLSQYTAFSIYAFLGTSTIVAFLAVLCATAFLSSRLTPKS